MSQVSHLRTIIKREISAYFNSTIAYIFLIVFTLLNGGLFMTQFFLIGSADMRSFFIVLPFLLAIFLPAISMNLWSEEKKGNTLELLLTFPMESGELVLGKFIASYIFYAISLFCTLTIPVMLIFLGNPDIGIILGGYLGALLLGGFFLAIGIFISGFFQDQIVSFILSMTLCLSLYLLGMEFITASIDGWIPGIGSFLGNFLGATKHYISFAKGVISFGDSLYFIVGIITLLFLNATWFKGRMRTHAKPIFLLTAFFCFGFFLITNLVFSNFSFGRIDLTEGRIYTVSQTTKNILKNLKSRATVKFYVSPSEKMPTAMKSLEQDVVNKLAEFRIASDGKFEYQIFHMETVNTSKKENSGESLEEKIAKEGIYPFQVQSIESDEVGVKLIYSSISLSYDEKPNEIIPRIYLGNLDQLEYLIISKLFRMTLEEEPKIAIMAPFEENALDPGMQALLAQLGSEVPDSYKNDNYEFLGASLGYEGYETVRIALNKKEGIPEDVKTLVVVEPGELTERQKYEINRFLIEGGSVFLAVQNYEYGYLPEGKKLELVPTEKNPRINDLISNWGFEVDTDILSDAEHQVINLSGAAKFGPFDLSIPIKLPFHILIAPSGMNEDISITSRLSGIFYLWGSAIKVNEKKIKEQGLKIKELLWTSKNSWTVPFVAKKIEPNYLNKNSESREGPFPVAVIAEGQFMNAFQGRDVPVWSETEGSDEDTEKIDPLELHPGKLILVGAATFFQKQMIQKGGHLNFFLNGIDVLTLGSELISIRSKGPIDRFIPKVSRAAKLIWRFFVTLFIPFLIIIAGFLRVLFRRNQKKKYLKDLAGIKHRVKNETIS